MADVYLVCGGTHGGHENSSVYSVWSDPDAAIAEAERLSSVDGAAIEIAVCERDTPRDADDVTWNAVPWRAFKDDHMRSVAEQ